MDLEERLNYLLVGRRDLRQRLRAAERDREDASDRAESLVRKIDEAKRMVIEAMERERNVRAKAAGGLSEDITDLEKELERNRDEAGTTGSVFASSKANLCRLVSNIDGVR